MNHQPESSPQIAPAQAFDKTKFVIRNAHTKAEMSQLDDEWANHKGPYLTLQQALELAKAHADQQPTHEKSA
jgi:hypothetical protein